MRPLPLTASSSSQSGNILFYVLIGIVLVGALTVALRMGGDAGKDPDSERLVIKATEVQRYAAQVQQAVLTMINKGVSEADVRFAHPLASADYGVVTDDPTHQVFGAVGGNIEYAAPVTNVNDGSQWEFFGTSDIPQVGSNKSELIAVLPNVTQEFCNVINLQLGFTPGTQPLDIASGASPDCVYSSSGPDRFTGSYDTTPNTLTAATFSRLPSMQACVRCGTSYHYFYVLLAR